MSKFSIEKMYQDYLKMVKLDGRIKNSQDREMRRVFFGACGQMLILLRDEVGNMEDEEEAIKVLEDLKNQIGSFWNKEANKLN